MFAEIRTVHNMVLSCGCTFPCFSRVILPHLKHRNLSSLKESHVPTSHCSCSTCKQYAKVCQIPVISAWHSVTVLQVKKPPHLVLQFSQQKTGVYWLHRQQGNKSLLSSLPWHYDVKRQLQYHKKLVCGELEV